MKILRHEIHSLLRREISKWRVPRVFVRRKISTNDETCVHRQSPRIASTLNLALHSFSCLARDYARWENLPRSNSVRNLYRPTPSEQLRDWRITTSAACVRRRQWDFLSNAASAADRRPKASSDGLSLSRSKDLIFRDGCVCHCDKPVVWSAFLAAVGNANSIDPRSILAREKKKKGNLPKQPKTDVRSTSTEKINRRKNAAH